MGRGSYSNGIKIGSLFLKQVCPITKIEKIIYDGLNSNPNIIRQYIKDIKKTNIECAPMYIVTKKILVEKYIKGQTIDEYINTKTVSKNDKILLIKKLLDTFKKSMKNPEIRIDWNLRNFIIKNKKIVLVDYIPSLYFKNLEIINQDVTFELYQLYKNYDIQITGIVGYTMMAFLNLSKQEFKQIYEIVFNYANEIYKIDKKKNHIFIKRINLIDKYLNSNLSKQEFVDKYLDMSLSKIMKQKLN